MKKRSGVEKRIYIAMWAVVAMLLFSVSPSADHVFATEITDIPDVIVTYGEEVENGICGADGNEDAMTWIIYEKTETDSAAEYTLVIRGTGSMADFDHAPWMEYCSSLKEVVIESGVTSVGKNAFSDCSNLTTVTIPDSVKHIGIHAFYKCKSLALITIPKELESIGNAAFYECKELAQIAIPSTVTSIGELAFRRCNKLSIEVDAENPYYVSFDGALFDKNMETLYWYPSASGDYTIPSSVRTIGSMAFEGSSLLNVTIPSSVKTIEMYSFDGCSSLKTVSLFDGLECIERNAFDGCSSLECLNIPDSVKSIGAYAFYNCSSLTNINIPDGIISIEEDTFYGCKKLETITIPDTVTSIGAEAFGACGLTAVDIKSSVKSIGDKAFYDCQNLKTVNISYGVEHIGDSAYAECSSLETVILPDSVKSLGDNAFDSCDALTSICYPDTLDMENTGIPDTAVKISYTVKDDGTVSIELVDVPRGVTEIPLPDNIGGKPVTSIDKNGVTVVVSHNHTSAGQATCKKEAACSVCGEDYLDFNNHANTEVRDAKAANCKAAGYTGDTWCKDCDTLVSVGSVIEKLTSHTWDAGIVTKEPTATATGEKLYTCTICGVTKAESIAVLGTESSETEGTEIKAPKKGTILTDSKTKAKYKVTKAGKKGGTVEYYRSTNKNAKTITMKATVKINGITYKVTSVAAKAFKNNTKITKVTIGSNVTTIGKEAFRGCKKLKTVTIGKNVTTIKEKAFYKCTAITKITLPSKVKNIGKQVFYGCKKLKSITIKTTKLTKKTVGSKAFTGTHKNVKVKVPAKKYKAYKTLLKSKGISSKAKITK